MRISDWSADVCSSDLTSPHPPHAEPGGSDNLDHTVSDTISLETGGRFRTASAALWRQRRDRARAADPGADRCGLRPGPDRTGLERPAHRRGRRATDRKSVV